MTDEGRWRRQRAGWLTKCVVHASYGVNWSMELQWMYIHTRAASLGILDLCPGCVGGVQGAWRVVVLWPVLRTMFCSAGRPLQ